MNNPELFYFELPAENRPKFSPLNEEVHNDFGWLSENRARSRGGDILNIIDTVVVHATSGYATQHAVDTWKTRKASAHWIIPDEDEPQHGSFIWAVVAEGKAAYHVLDSVNYEPIIGKGPNVNNRSLGIEVVNTQDVQRFSDSYSTWQILSVAQIILYAWSKYPNLRHIVSHARLDPKRRSDPGRNFPWDKMKNLVLSHEALPKRNPLVTAEYVPKEPVEYTGNCCTP